MKTKLFSLFLALAASIGTMIASVQIGNLYYNLDTINKTAETTYKSLRYTSIQEYNYDWDITSADIPESVNYMNEDYTVVGIGYKTFSSCSNLTTVTIPHSITTISDFAFLACVNLPSISIPNSVTNIGRRAFMGCSNLTSITLSNRLIDIADGLFWNCTNFKMATIPYSVTSIGPNAFSGCTGLTYIDMPNSVTSIGSSAFSGCTGLTTVTIPDSVTSIGEYAFRGCSGLTSVTIPNSVTSIGDNGFNGCTGLTSVTIPNGVTSIGASAFRDCSSLTSVTIPNSVTSIRESAFRGCSSLTSVTIPNSVTSIGQYAFSSCSGLTSVTIEAETPPTLGSGAFDYTNDCPIYVPCGTLDVYKTAWTNYASRISYAPLPYKISTQAVYGSVGITSLENYTICDEQPYHSLTVTANYGYHFVQWSDGNTDNPRTIVLTQDTSFTAKFAKNTYQIAVVINENEGTASYPTQSEYLDEIAMTVMPNYGYHFVQWSDGDNDNPRTIVLTQDTILEAIFGRNTYNLFVENSSSGTVSGAGTYLYQAECTLTVTPEYGYHFTQWSDGNTDNPRMIVLASDTTFTAEFAHNPTITYVYDSQMGSVTGPATTATGIAAENITFNATPNYGYHFVQWSDGNTDNPRTIWISQDTTFTAEFAIDKSGTCGKDNLLQWTFADDGTLTISGSGELTENYTFGLEAPTQMQQLVVGNEVTAIGERAFYEKTTLQKLIIGSNVTSIGKYAFASINNRQLTSLVMPAELLTIGDYAFSENTYVESIDFNVKLQTIGAYAFNDCYRVSEMTCLATVTPDLGTDALASINSYASLCVPAECLRKYQVDPNWGRFDLCELGASSTTTDGKTVIVEPSDNTALFTWPTENNAGSYTLQISKDGEVFCTLVFNSNGQLTGIAFAPGRNGAAHAPAATMSVAGMSFTVTGLDGASKYAYRLAVTNDASEELVAYSGEFATTGYNGEVNPGGNPEGIEDVFTDEHKASKILRDGQIFILRGEKEYTLTGQEVK